jgi:hypothetical protein
MCKEEFDIEIECYRMNLDIREAKRWNELEIGGRLAILLEGSSILVSSWQTRKSTMELANAFPNTMVIKVSLQPHPALKERVIGPDWCARVGGHCLKLICTLTFLRRTTET